MAARRSVAEGRTYLEDGRPVLVRLTWAGRGPHNALIRREDGTEVVRPFRGLRRPMPGVDLGVNVSTTRGCPRTP